MDGRVLEGHFKFYKLHGQGREVYPDGIVHEGEFKDGIFIKSSLNPFVSVLKKEKDHIHAYCTSENSSEPTVTNIKTDIPVKKLLKGESKNEDYETQ